MLAVVSVCMRRSMRAHRPVATTAAAAVDGGKNESLAKQLQHQFSKQLDTGREENGSGRVMPNVIARCWVITSRVLQSRPHRRGGVNRISGLVYEETRRVLKVFLGNVIHDAVIYTEHSHGRCVCLKAPGTHSVRICKLKESKLY